MRGALGWVLAVALLLAVDAAVIAIVGTHGNFPLGDDWAYAWPVRSLCERGEIDLLPWTGASVVAEIGYGAALCKAYGFSFEVLRESTLALGVATDLGVLALAQLFGVPMPVAVVAALAFALTPLRVNLGFTFMSDVPFAAFALWGAYFLARGLRSKSTPLLVLGALLAAISALIRQHGIFLAAAAALAALPRRDPDQGVSFVTPEADPKAERKLRRRLGLKPLPTPEETGSDPIFSEEKIGSDPVSSEEGYARRFRRAAVCLAPALAALVVYYLWLLVFHGAPEAVARKASEATSLHATVVGNLAFRALETLGASLLPITALAIGLVLRASPIRSFFAMLVLGALAGFLWARDAALMPYLPNIVYDLGVGPLTLRDTLYLGMQPPLSSGVFFRWPLTIVATVSAAVLVVLWLSASRALRSAEGDFVALALLFLFGGSLLHARYYFDRYLLGLLPLAAVLAAIGLEETRLRRRVQLDKAVSDATETRIGFSVGAAVTLLIVGYFSVAGTRDWMEMNRARYALLDQLLAEGVTPDRIDGGMEFNAWHLAKASGHAPTNQEVTIGHDSAEKSWWWVVDDEYVIATQDLAGYEIYALRKVDRWLVPGETTVYALRRSAEATSLSPSSRLRIETPSLSSDARDSSPALSGRLAG